LTRLLLKDYIDTNFNGRDPILVNPTYNGPFEFVSSKAKMRSAMMSLGTKTSSAPVKNRHKTGGKPNDVIELDRTELEQRCTQALLVILPQMRQIINRDQERESDGSGITVQQYSVLKALQGQKRLISELAEMLKVSRPTMSRIIDGLEGRRKTAGPVRESQRPKLVERVACLDDHRLVYARITEEGQAILQKYNAKAEDNITGILGDLPPQELVTLLQSLEVLAGAIQAKS
jgi:DNA-binding MarR family transcriptional regulator